MPTQDLNQYATSDTDFYELLGISFETSQKDIDRAWRKTALKYHPDKVGNDLVAKDKYHLAQIGYDLLSDPSSKAIYDNARSARLQRKRQNELFEGRRRQMKDDLETRERGGKRARDEGDAEEEQLEIKIRRLAEDGKRRRLEMDERRRLEREEVLRRREMERDNDHDGDAEKPAQTNTPASNSTTSAPPTKGIADIDRTVKVRWPLNASDGSFITAEQITDLFSTFGKIENADLLKPKMLRLSNSKKKQLAVVCMVEYSSIVSAYAAVVDFPKQEGSAWKVFDSVAWASNKEPQFINDGEKHENGTAAATGNRISTSITRLASGLSLKELEDFTLMRLKETQRRKVAAEIRKGDEEA